LVQRWFYACYREASFFIAVCCVYYSGVEISLDSKFLTTDLSKCTIACIFFFFFIH
jgi:hypothetical protein